jgi:hypothetical protein
MLQEGCSEQPEQKDDDNSIIKPFNFISLPFESDNRPYYLDDD